MSLCSRHDNAKMRGSKGYIDDDDHQSRASSSRLFFFRRGAKRQTKSASSTHRYFSDNLNIPSNVVRAPQIRRGDSSSGSQHSISLNSFFLHCSSVVSSLESEDSSYLDDAGQTSEHELSAGTALKSWGPFSRKRDANFRKRLMDHTSNSISSIRSDITTTEWNSVIELKYTLMGMNLHLDHHKADKVAMLIQMCRDLPAIEVKMSPSSFVSALRLKLERIEVNVTIPRNFVFLYSDGTPVQSYDEANTRIKSCWLPDGSIRTKLSSEISISLPFELHIPASLLYSISTEGETVIRCCLRILEKLSTRTSIFAVELPDPLLPCAFFCKNIARAITSSSQNLHPACWNTINSQLVKLGEILELMSNREAFSALMSYRHDMQTLNGIIKTIQKKLLKDATISHDHPVFFVRVEQPSPSLDSLLSTVWKASFLDLCGDKHARTRRGIADFLRIDDLEVINRIKNHGLTSDGMFDTAIVHNSTQLSMGIESFRSLKDMNIVKEILAPNIDSQETLITSKAAKFNSGTCQWAIKAFDDWCQYPGVHRCFLFSGQEALGKTVFASHIVRTYPDNVLASHYCRHDDVTTINPKVMLLSLSYQLCRLSLSFQNEIRCLLVDRRWTRNHILGKSYTIVSLFRDFLENPLRSVDMSTGHEKCIVIDGVELGSVGDGEQNPILKAIRNFLFYLPPWIRFFVTTRPRLSILKRFRIFNAKLVEPKEHKVMLDMAKFFFDSLTRSCYGSEEERDELAKRLAENARGNYVYGAIIDQKAQAALREGNPLLLGEYVDLDFDSMLKKDLDIVTNDQSELFWQVVRFSLVAFRALNKVDVVTITGCTASELEQLLHSARTFFVVTDESIIRFSQKLIKRWLLNALSRNNGSWRNIFDKVGLACTTTKFGDEIKSCHEQFAMRILRLLEMSRHDNHVTIPHETTKSYILHYGFQHLILGGKSAEARDLLLDPMMLIERAKDSEGLLTDFSMLSNDDELIQLIKRALSLSIPAIKNDSRQILSQLFGRLKATTLERHGNPTLRAQAQVLLNRLKDHDYGFNWWCPVGPTWDQAEQPLVRRLNGHETQIQCVDLHRDNMLCVTASCDGELRVWNMLLGHIEAQFSGHKKEVWCAVWSSDGQRIVSSGADATVRVWNFQTRETELVLNGHQDCVFTVKFSPDSSRIASGSKDGSIRIWNVFDGKCEQVIPGEGFIYSVDWKPCSGNRYICSGGTDNLVRVWDLETLAATVVCRGHSDWVRGVTWSFNGCEIFSCSADQTAFCWDAETGECEQVLMGHTGGIWTIEQSKDGRYLFTGSADKTIKVWECATWQCDQTLMGHNGPVVSVSVSTDGSKAISGGSDNSLIEWDCEVDRNSRALSGHNKPIWGMDVSNDSTHVVSASSDHTARIWNLKTASVERVFIGHSGPVWAVKFSHSNRFIATASSDNTAAIYRVMTGGRKLILMHGEAVWDIAWSKDDRYLFTASRDHIIRRWNSKSGKCEGLYFGHKKDVKSLSLSPDGSRLASASTDISVRVWNLANGKCDRVLKRKESGALSVTWLSNSLLAVGYASGCVRLWNADTGERLVGFLPGHSRRTNSVCASPDGTRIVSASTDKEVRIWNVALEKCEHRFQGNYGSGVFCVKWLKDGKSILSAGSDRSIHVWNAETGRCEEVMGDDSGIGIYEVSWSPSGKRLASGSCDRTVQIWDTDTGECLHTFKGHTNWVHGIDWDTSGTRVLSRSDDGTSRVWNVETGKCEKRYDEILIPDGFIVGSVASNTLDLSGRANEFATVGIQCQKVRVSGSRCCGWVGKTVKFFKLKESAILLENPRGVNIVASRLDDTDDDSSGIYMADLKD